MPRILCVRPPGVARVCSVLAATCRRVRKSKNSPVLPKNRRARPRTSRSVRPKAEPSEPICVSVKGLLFRSGRLGDSGFGANSSRAKQSAPVSSETGARNFGPSAEGDFSNVGQVRRCQLVRGPTSGDRALEIARRPGLSGAAARCRRGGRLRRDGSKGFDRAARPEPLAPRFGARSRSGTGGSPPQPEHYGSGRARRLDVSTQGMGRSALRLRTRNGRSQERTDFPAR